jgi:replicative DNA helicase
MDNIEIEEKFISILLTYRENVAEWTSSRIGIEYFAIEHKNIISGILFSYNKNVLLTRHNYKDFLAEYKHLNHKEAAGELAIFDKCFSIQENKDNAPVLLDNIKKHYIKIKTAESFKLYNKDRDAYGELDANRKLAERLSCIETESADSPATFVELEKEHDSYMEALRKRRESPSKRLTCGIPEIDETMSVGFAPGQLTVFAAQSGSFKTTMMTNIATNVFKKSGENVLYLPLEMSYQEIMNKIVARETKIDLYKIEHAELLSEDEISQISGEIKKWQDFSNKFSILDMSERVKVSTIRAEVEKRISYFKPAIIFIDYADNLLPEKNNNRSDLELHQILSDLIYIGKKHSCHIVTAAQLSSDAIKRLREQKEGKESFAITDLKGGQTYANDANNLYAQTRHPSQPNEQLLFFCLKARGGKTSFRNNATKAILHVNPAISLIESPYKDDFTWNNKDSKVDSSILEMMHNMPTQEELDKEDEPF